MWMVTAAMKLKDASSLEVKLLTKVHIVKAMVFPVQFSSVTQSCLTRHDPMDCSLPGSSIHGIFQARILEWVAISFSRYADDTTIMAESEEELKSLLIRVKEESEKAGLKLNIKKKKKKLRSWHLVPSFHGK